MSKSIRLPSIREIDPSIAYAAVASTEPFKLASQRVKCPECAYTTRDKADMARHSNDRHKTVRLYQCKICGLCTTQSTNTKQHVPREACCILSFRSQDDARTYQIDRNGVNVTVVVGEIMFTPDQLAIHRRETGNPNLTEDEARKRISIAPKELLYQKVLEFRQETRNRCYTEQGAVQKPPPVVHISTCAHCGGAYDSKRLIQCHSCQRLHCFQHASCPSIKPGSVCRHCDDNCAGKS